MTIKILELHQIQDGYTLAKVRHSEDVFDAFVLGDKETLSGLIGKNIVVEINYDRINRWGKIENYNGEMSCIRAAEDKSKIVVRGEVHNITKVTENIAVIDIYLRNGAEFVAVDSTELGETPELGTGIELEVSEIRFYPYQL